MTGSRFRPSGTAVAVGLAAALVVSSAAFAVDLGGGRPDAVAFEDTIVVAGTTAVGVKASAREEVVPKTEIFFSQYRYVVGTYGVGSAVELLGRQGTNRQFGRPLVVYVSDFAGTGVELADDGALVVPDGGSPDWVAATEAYFVVDSEARTPAGPTVVPFSEQAAAREFASAHGGEVRRWSALRDREFATVAETRERLQGAVSERRAWANRTVADARELLDRPVSVVVGEDAPTLQAAVDAAPSNTTVRIPAGTYRVENVTVRKPLTLRGAGNGSHVVGNRNGSVVRAFADRVAVTDLAISGVGANLSTRTVPRDDRTWDYQIQLGYGFAPAAVELGTANGSLVSDVAIRTESHGVAARRSDATVVTDVTVNGTEKPFDGFMGVMLMESRVVVQDSTFRGGRDGVYAHRAHDMVVRDNRMTGLRFGVHEMYTNGALVTNNTVRRATVGVVVMTRPTTSLVVGNDVRDSDNGLGLSGTGHYVAGNVLAFNDVGIDLAAQQSLVERNVVAYNGVGFGAETLVPSNWVVRNDVVGNDRPARATLGPLRVWGVDGRGNYWANAPGFDRDGDGALDRPYAPTGTVDAMAGRRAGASTLAQSPAVSLLRSLADVASGLRSTGVLDYAPRTRPVRPTAVESVRQDAKARGVMA